MDNVFRKNESQIVNVLGNQDKDEGQFSPMQVVNNKMNNTILGNKKEQPTRRIANTLLYLERKDEDTLYRMFIETYKARLRKELKFELTKNTTAVEERKNKTEPKKWPPMIDEQLGMLQDPIILIKDPTRGSFIQEYGQENVYKIQGKCRGKVFIINNVNFDRRVGDRNGSNIDAENLRKLFRDLHFTVHQQDNLTANDMKYFLQKEAQNLDKEYCTECIILIIMSHGRGTRVFGVDWVPVELKTLTQYFSSDNCPILHGKPRLVFVQACRSVDEVFIEKTLYSVNIGVDVKIDCVIKTVKPVLEVFWEKNSKGYKPVYINANSAKYLLQSSQSNKSLTIRKAEISDQGKYRCIVKHDQYEQSNATELTVYEKDYNKNDFSNKYEQLKTRPGQLKDSEPSPCESKEPSLQQNSFFDHPSADFLTAYATPEGAMAWLNNEVGSWFMNAIVWTFKYHAHEEELHQLLIRVNRLVGKGRTRSNDTTVAEMTSNLRKKFYFFPGIHSNPPVLFSD